MIRISGSVLGEDGRFEPATISVRGAAIDRVVPQVAGAGTNDGSDDAGAPLIIPGLVDIHCHGGFGVDFPTADTSEALEAIDRIQRTGTTTLLASLVTAAPEQLVAGAKLFSALTASGHIAGIHSEGPFLSHARCGAQNPNWLSNPDLTFAQDLIDAADGTLRTMTFAPELPGAEGLVDLLARAGVVPSVGHTAADFATTRKALAQARESLSGGAQHSGQVPTVTHLFNGMDPLHHRAPGALTACLRAARDGQAVVELIADNVHLAPEVVAMVFELVGADNIALVTDSMAAAGLSDGTYSLGPSSVEVAGGVARLSEGGSIAGGTSAMIDLVRNAVKAGVPLEQAVHSATRVPARAVGLPESVGVLKPGAGADLLVLNRDLDLLGVMRRGAWLVNPGL